MRKSRVIITSLVAAAAALIVALVVANTALTARLGQEGYKQLWQLAVASIVGGLVSAAFSELRREQDARDARREFVRAFHSSALSAYNRAKKTRRLLKAKTAVDRDRTPALKREEYESHMNELQDIQLQFESLHRQARLSSNVFVGTPELEAKLKSMEGFLREVLMEFEQSRLLAPGAVVPLGDLPQLRAFIDYSSSAPFVSRFSDPYDGVETSLLKLLS